MSKLQFRARALDASKPMPIYMAEELPDLTDYSAINRAVPQMPSGMEKEEECEHHLQRAICTGLIIPTPEVASMADVDAYDKIYPANYKQPRQLIHMQPFTMEQEIPDYDMDSEDETWVEEQARRLDLTPLKFESMMDRLEKSSGQTVVTLHDAKALLKEDDDLIIAIFDYWLNKRLKTQHPLILAVKTEHRLGSAANNPYLAFRRRTEKMQTRKNRKNDETSYEKMLKLRRDLSRAVTLLEMVKRREKTKREHLHLTIEIVEKRYQAQDFSGQLLAEVSALRTSRPAFAPLFTNQFTNQNWTNKATIKDDIIPRKEKRQYKKRKHKPTTSHTGRNILNSSGLEPIISSDEDDVNSNPMLASAEESETTDVDESRYTFRRNKHCSYYMPITNKLGNWPWCSREENGTADHRYRYALTSIKHPKPRCIGFARRRLGRGGRVILDRMSTPYDDLWREMDYTIIETPSLRERLALLQCQQKLKKANVNDETTPKPLNNVDDVEMQMQHSVVQQSVVKCTSSSSSSSCLNTNKTISSMLSNYVSGVSVTTPTLRNLYSEHNYNSTTPTTMVIGGYPPDGYPSSTSIVKTEFTDSNNDTKQSFEMKEERQSWTSDVSNVKGVKRETYDDTSLIQPQVISEVTTSVAHIHVNSSYSDTNTNQLDKSVNANSHEQQQEDSNINCMLEVLSEIKRDWLHFRPKTPPSDYEIPCNLLPAKEDIFNPNEFTPITIEIENLSSTSLSALNDTSNFTSEFTLNDIYTDLNIDYQLQQEQQQQQQDHSIGLEQDNENVGLILNDIRQSVSPSTDISDNSSCLCSTNYLTDHQDSTMINFGCSRVSVRSKSDRECERERTTNNLISDVLTTRRVGGDVTNSGNSYTSMVVTTANNNFIISSSVTSKPRRNIQFLHQNTNTHQKQQQQRATHQHQQVLRTQSILSSTLTNSNKLNNSNNSNSTSNINNMSMAAGSTVGTVTSTQIPTLIFDRVTGNVSSPVASSVSGVRMIGTLATAGLVRASPVSEHAIMHTNGPLNTQLESSMIRRVNYKPSATDESFLGDHSRLQRLQNNTSMNSQVRRTLLSSQTINTLNSNSANIMDQSSISSPLPNESSTLINNDSNNSVKMKSTLHHLKTGGDNNLLATVTQQSGTPTVNTSGGQSTGTTNNSSKPQIVRKNNTLAMEVT